MPPHHSQRKELGAAIEALRRAFEESRPNYRDERGGLYPEIFDDPIAMARNGLDMDIADAARFLLDHGADLDNRSEVERAIGRQGETAFAKRFVDAVIAAARHQQIAD